MAVPSFLVSYFSSLKSLKTLLQQNVFSASLLKMLDDETTQFVFELLHTNLHLSTIKHIPNIKERLNLLISLSLIKKIGNNIALDPYFRQSILNCLVASDFDYRFKKTTFSKNNFDPSSLSQSKLKSTSDIKFRSILEHISSKIEVDLFGVKEVIEFCELTNRRGEITNKGFEFLLKTRKDQLWYLIVHSVRFYASNPQEEYEMLQDLSEILMKKEQGPFISEKLSNWYLFLDSLGVIFLTEKTSSTVSFCVFNNDLFDEQKTSNGRKYLVLETNFKIYAYTSQSYEKSVLSLFSKTEIEFPNLVKACFDEASLMAAFNKGITGRQVIKYIQEYSDLVPKNVIHQINIWEQKLHRIRLRNGYLYHDFIHLSDFLKVVKFIEAKGTLIYKDESKRIVVGEDRSHDEVRDYIKSLNS